MRAFTIALCLLSSIHTQGQHFFKLYDVQGDYDAAWSLAATPHGLLIASGSQCSSNGEECIGLKLINDLDGSVIWEKIILEPNHFIHLAGVKAILADNDSTFLLTGKTFTDSNQICYFVLKAKTTTGDTIWVRKHPDKSAASFTLLPAIEGGYLLLGQARDSLTNKSQPTVLHLDSIGNILEIRDYANPDTSSGSLDLSLDANGGYIMLRYQVGPSIQPHLGIFATWPVFVERLDAQRDIVWSSRIDTVSNTLALTGASIGLSNGDYAIGYAEDYSHDLFGWPYFDTPCYVMRLDENGQLIWKWIRYESTSFRRYLRNIVEAPNGDILGVGTLIDTTNFASGWAFRLSADGQLLWERLYSRFNLPARTFGLYGICLTSDGDIALSGVGDTIGALELHDMALLKVDAMGCLTSGCEGVFVPLSTDESQTDAAFLTPVFSIEGNPSGDGILKLHFDQFIKTGRVYVSALNGALQDMFVVKNTQSITCNLSRLRRGVYVVTFVDERTGVPASAKWVVE
ncbi:MAG: hypothetical protein JNJ57_13885 [Saprospiraceae bacterium]|nr:hypothetical protein [Saprospiraceae bacterium]